MFERLIASQQGADSRPGWRAGLAALCQHAALIAGAVFATVRAAEPAQVTSTFELPVYVPLPTGHPVPAVSVGGPGDLPAIDLPTDILDGLPPLDHDALLGPGIPFPGTERVGGLAPASYPGGDVAYVGALIEDAPLLLSGPPLVYPELLRQAGVQGCVEVAAIVDTSGRVEAASITIVRTPHPGFERPAREFVRGALFRPGRVGGRAVRVLIRLPIVFALR